MPLMLHLIYSVAIGLLVYVVGCFFDKSPDNRSAGIAGLLAFVLAFLGFVSMG